MAYDCGNGDGATRPTTALRSHGHRHGDPKMEEARDPSKGVDSISSLPDEILHIILSSIPTKFAIRTSTLSKRWRHVWSDTPSLSFNFARSRPEANSINKTLDRYTARKMMSFRLCARISHYISHIDRWIKFAMSRNAENMSLSYGFHVPDYFCINNSVKQLDVALLYFYLEIPSRSVSVSWASLKMLSLRRCRLSRVCIDKILCGCPILESLKIYFCDDDLRVLDVRKSQSLRTLEIDRNIRKPGPTQIVAPQIHCLNLRNSQLPCTLVDVSSLTEASLYLCFSSTKKLTAEFLQDMFLKILDKLQNVDKLTFGANFLEILSLAELSGVPFPSFKVKDLTFKTLVYQCVVPGLVRLLQNSPELKKLTVRTRNPGTVPERQIIDMYLELQGLNPVQCWNVEARVTEKVASLMELMLKTTKILEKMVVKLEGYLGKGHFEELLGMVRVLSDNNHNVSIVLSR